VHTHVEVVHISVYISAIRWWGQ